MMAVAGGILLALFVLFILFGAVAAIRDTFRFAMRHKPYTLAVLGALALGIAVSVAGSYDQSPAYRAFAQH
jgi:hypothetical protein